MQKRRGFFAGASLTLRPRTRVEVISVRGDTHAAILLKIGAQGKSNLASQRVRPILSNTRFFCDVYSLM